MVIGVGQTPITPCEHPIGRGCACRAACLPGRDAPRCDPERVSTVDDRTPSAPDVTPVEGLDRLRVLLAAAMGTVLVSYAVLVPAVAVMVLSAGGGLSADAAFAAAIPLWLAAHQIPLALGGQPLSVLPLRADGGGRRDRAVRGTLVGAAKLGGRFRMDAGPVLASIAGAHAAVAVLGSALLPRSTEVAAAPWAAMVGGGLVAGTGAVIGVLRACGLPPEWTQGIPGWARVGVRGAAVAVVALLVAGALMVLAALVIGAPSVAEAYRAVAPDFGAGVGITLLALAYLPNAIVGGHELGTRARRGRGVGRGLAVRGVPRGALRLPAPGRAAHDDAARVGARRPAAAGRGGRAGRADRPRALPLSGRLSAAGATIVLTAAAVGLLAELSGGRLAAGAFDPVQVPVGLVVPAALLLVGVPTLVVASVQGRGEASGDGGTRTAAAMATAIGEATTPPAATTTRGPAPARGRAATHAQGDARRSAAASHDGGGARRPEGTAAGRGGCGIRGLRRRGHPRRRR